MLTAQRVCVHWLQRPSRKLKPHHLYLAAARSGRAFSDNGPYSSREPILTGTMENHYEEPDAGSAFRMSYTLQPIELDKLTTNLSNFETAKSVFTQMVLDGNHEQIQPYVDHNALELFEAVFPELVESRQIGRLQDHHFQSWGVAEKKSEQDIWNKKAESLPIGNNVNVMLEPDGLRKDEHVDFLAVGGPSTFASALLHKAQYPQESAMHIISHRFDSNADGSAYYYHERDAFPAYVNRVNTGWYCVYADLQKRFRSTISLVDSCRYDRNHVKISIHWPNLVRNPGLISSILLPNVYHSLMDLLVRSPRESAMAQACRHSQLVPQIVERVCGQLNLPVRAFLCRDPHRAVHIEIGGANQASEYFAWLGKYADLPHESISDSAAFGPLVTETLAFENDGALNPWLFENFYKAFDVHDIRHQKGWLLDRLYVTPDSVEPHRLMGTAARFKNMTTGKVKVVSFSKLTLSLGPSASIRIAEDTQLFGCGVNAHDKTMWAGGSSSVCLLGVKRGAVPKERVNSLRKFIDGVNQHWTLISERMVRTGNTTYDFFAIQVTGGGHFPSRHFKPDFVLNLLHSTEAVFGLHEFQKGDILYDIVQSRGCGRSISAGNTLSFCPIAKNVVSAYALGGIGMTTAFANGALQLQILEALPSLKSEATLLTDAAKGIIGRDEASETLECFYGKNIFDGVNYSYMIDDPQHVARALNVDRRLSHAAYQMLCCFYLTFVCAAVAAGLT